jgi:hypothetical protein
MNTHTSSEHAAAQLLQEHAASLVAGYAQPQDLAASRLALLMIACQQEAKAQGISRRVIFEGEEE